jgi:hypothetical protein
VLEEPSTVLEGFFEALSVHAFDEQRISDPAE